MAKDSQNPQDCPLCLSNNLFKGEVIAKTDNAYLTTANSKPGNYLIIPLAHAESLTELPDDWWQGVKTLLPSIPNLPNSYNVSFNIGKDAGQTTGHLHLWVIPRESGVPSSGKGFVTLIERADETG